MVRDLFSLGMYCTCLENIIIFRDEDYDFTNIGTDEYAIAARAEMNALADIGRQNYQLLEKGTFFENYQDPNLHFQQIQREKPFKQLYKENKVQKKKKK